jgi:DNA-binding response OmpR family regulator
VKILIAEDDAFFRRLLHELLAPDFELDIVADGDAAWDSLQTTKGPILAILDWVMPGLAGPEICRAVRCNPKTADTYLILVTSRNSSADIVAGLRSGADDYITKPFRPEELRARVRLGQRIIRLEQSLAAKKALLESAFEREAFLRNRLAMLESVHPKEMTEGDAAGQMRTGSIEALSATGEFGSGETPLPPVNDSKVS